MLKDLRKNYSKEDQMKILQDYINKPHIANIIITKMFDINNYNNEDNTYAKHYNGKDGKIIHAAFSWNPHNLVYGPGYSNNGRPLRGREPGSNIDTELYDKQSDQNKQKINDFSTNGRTAQEKIEIFGGLDPNNKLDWKRYNGTNRQVNGIHLHANKYYDKDTIPPPPNVP